MTKESSITGLLHWATNSLHHKKEDCPPPRASCSTSNVLQNISPESTVGRNCQSQLIMDNLPKSLQAELKENISPENTMSTLSSEYYGQCVNESKVVFQVGDGDDDGACDVEERLAAEIDKEFYSANTGQKDLGQITRDSLSILKHEASAAEMDQK